MTVGNDPTVHYALNGQSVAQEGHLDQGNFVPDVTYLNGPRGVEYRQDSNGTSWYLYDGLGSVVAEVNDQGSITATRKYDVYGAVRAETGSSDSKNEFVGGLGHTIEPETGGLIYMRARWMDPVLGRFVSEDPGKNGTNWYAYCNNNPVGNVDQDGKIVIPAVAAVAAVTAGSAVAGYLGYGLGYMHAVSLLQQDDPIYQASPNWFAGGAVAAATAILGNMGSAKGAIWGRGIGPASLASFATPWMAASFIVGFESGMIAACLDYIGVQNNRERYGDL